MHETFFGRRRGVKPRGLAERALSVILVALLMLPAGAAAAAHAAAGSGGSTLSSKVVFFSSDGMRPDLMERYAAQGAMPTYASLMASGVRGDNGMVQAFPPNTGVGWYTMMTGAYPGEHGS